MNAKGSKKVILLLLGLALTTLYAQQTLNATGSTATGTGGSATYSVGQVAYETNTSAEGSVAQGVQHAYEIFEINEGPVQFRDIYKGISISVSAKLSPNTGLWCDLIRGYIKQSYSFLNSRIEEKQF